MKLRVGISPRYKAVIPFGATTESRKGECHQQEFDENVECLKGLGSGTCRSLLGCVEMRIKVFALVDSRRLNCMTYEMFFGSDLVSLFQHQCLMC